MTEALMRLYSALVSGQDDFPRNSLKTKESENAGVPDGSYCIQYINTSSNFTGMMYMQ